MKATSLQSTIYLLGWDDGWEDGCNDGDEGLAARANYDDTAADDEPTIKRIYKDGYARGYAEGYADGCDLRTEAEPDKSDRSHRTKPRSSPGSLGFTRALETLGISALATPMEIKAAFRKLAQIYHPDRYHEAPPDVREEAEKRMKEIAWARDLLLRAGL